jgi:hypothetical protein
MANLLHATLGNILSATPTAELVNNKSNGAASSSAPEFRSFST